MTPREAHGLVMKALSGGSNLPISFDLANASMGVLMKGVVAFEAAATLAPSATKPLDRAETKPPEKSTVKPKAKLVPKKKTPRKRKGRKP